MKLAHVFTGLILAALIFGLAMGPVTANVPGVALNAPPPPPAPNVAAAGSEQTIKVVVTHRDTGTPSLHYVDSVMLYDGDKLLKEFKYDQSNYKKDDTWTESFSTKVNSDMHLRAVAHCTEHGYDMAGVHMRVLPAGTKPSDMMRADSGYAGMQAFGYQDVGKASDYLSSAGSKFLGGIVKARSSDLKSFQGKLSDWMKSEDGKQFMAQRDQQMAKPTAKMLKVRYASATPTAKIRRSIAVYAAAGSSNIPRISEVPTFYPVSMGKSGKIVSPKASVKPSAAVKSMKASPAAKVKASPGVKYLQARPPATSKISPTPAASPSIKPRTPAESYGIYGLGGKVQSLPMATVTVRPVPSGSPTPVPGRFTPRFPGEPGYGKSTPTPTAVAKISPSPTAQPLMPLSTIGGTSGVAGKTSLTSYDRYAARGPGIMDGSIAMPPPSAPGPMASPSPRPIKR